MANEAYTQFGEWLKKQPWWIQDAAWRIYHGQTIDEKQIDQYVQMCVSQAKNVAMPYNVMPDGDVIPKDLKPKMSIKSISDITNVNALADNTSLAFSEEGVSVVYGLNGAGKSGFMRIIKHVSGNPYAEIIQGNVFKKSGNNMPACTFTLSIDGSESSVVCDLSTECQDKNLRQCDVFDTRISGGYVTSSNSVSYEPFVFSVLRELASIAGRIETAVQSKIDSIPLSSLSIPNDFLDIEEAKWLYSISADTSIPEIFLSWSPSDSERLVEIKKLLNLEQVESRLNTAKQQKEQIQNIQNDLAGIKEIFVNQRHSELTTLFSDMDSKKKRFEAAKELFSKSASQQDKESVSVEVWRNLWTLARQYYETCLHNKIGKEFASEGSICPLCLQRIEGQELSRFATVDGYVSGSCSEEYEASKNAFIDKYKQSLNHKYTSSIVSEILGNAVDDELLHKTISFYQVIDELQNAQNPTEKYTDIQIIENSEIFDKIDDALNRTEDEIQRLMSILSEDSQKALQNEQQLLVVREWVHNQTSLITDAIKREVDRSDLNSAKQFLNTGRITKESNSMADQLISEAYIERFANELKLLAPRLKVKIEKGQSVKGKSPYKVVLDTDDKIRKNPQDVLSEGEQRIVALAAFFADATGRNERTPIVIDDPISSLDNNYEESAAKRIVELSKERQVIVFTHRISLLVGLGDRCKMAGVDFTEHHIRSTQNGKGVPDYEEIYHGSIKTQLNALIDRVKETKIMDPDSHPYIDSCSRISQQLRICIERSVEDVLFQEMVKRFRRRIMTGGKLLKMDRITAADCKIIDDMMTKYSYDEHSQPEDSGIITMDLDEVIEDITKFREWIKEYTARMK